jgi:hypothetical protein
MADGINHAIPTHPLVAAGETAKMQDNAGQI